MNHELEGSVESYGYLTRSQIRAIEEREMGKLLRDREHLSLKWRHLVPFAGVYSVYETYLKGNNNRLQNSHGINNMDLGFKNLLLMFIYHGIIIGATINLLDSKF